CLNKDSGAGRQWGLAGNAADASVKELRVYNQGAMTFRGFFKFCGVEMDGYSGPALLVEAAKDDSLDRRVDREDWALFYRHAVAKAQAMNAPLVLGMFPKFYDDPLNPYVPGRIDQQGHAYRCPIFELAGDQGLDLKTDVPLDLIVDEGHLRAHHSDA